ncbi:MAG: 7-cyano-7-deazaguanine synthase [Chitinivibrionia bacterium]|nr:7-cyano-7-deazaguanine synthase [Chitinivibrionia bacterium]
MSTARSGRAIALVSGGLDSVVSLACAVRELDVRLVLFFNYGQRALQGERRAALGAVNFYSIPFREIELEWLRDLCPPRMVSSAARREDAIAGGPGDDGIGAVWIPNRNGVFVNTAAAFAESCSCDYVVTGFNLEEAQDFPDNRREYAARLNRCLALSTMNKVKVVSFTQDMTKARIISMGMNLSAPLSIVWSCYSDGEIMCGTCPSCARLKSARLSLPPAERPVLQFEGGPADGMRGRDNK